MKKIEIISLSISAISIIAFIIISITCIISSLQNKKCGYTCHVYKDNIELKLQQTKGMLVDEVEKYIKSVAPTSTLNASVLVELCDNYNIDIKFVLAQGHIESHFGTRGLASKTNSVFNVFAYDGHSYNRICKHGKYSHPDHSIAPYLKLLYNDYIVDDKTEYDLLDNYVNKNGDRYASAIDYERKLTNTFNNINENTNIDELVRQYKKYKILSGK